MLIQFISQDQAAPLERPHEAELFARLKALRFELARTASVPAYVIFSDATLLELATYLPQEMADLLRISGFGEVKLSRYGEAFLNVIVNYCLERGLPTRIDQKREKNMRRYANPRV
jgi:ATP-dependent DNA helicase RecQ